jgi:uncharacterized GH25 family protein
MLLAGSMVILTHAQPQEPKQSRANASERSSHGEPDSAKANGPGLRPDLVGRVTADDVIPKATVFIFTAGPKVGTSTFCPSCYADCRKSAKTDAQGEFKIESLDPQLIFRILVVAKGYKPQFVSKVNPAKGRITVDLEPVESEGITPERSIRGQVVDSEGNPVIGAVVEAHGIRKKNDIGTMWGQLPGVDPLAVTDEQGEFQLASREPFQSLDVNVEAPGFAHRKFTSLNSGLGRHKLTLTEGAIVKGRVVWKDKPLADVSVGVAGVERDVERYVGNFDVGTDNDGRFALMNLPPNVDYFIYGLMKNLRTYGAIPVRKIHAGDDGSTTDVGDLLVERGQRLAGRVVCDDEDFIPENTRLLVSRQQAWDSMQLTLDENGRFDTEGVPKETLSLSVRIAGYRISARNASLDTLNPFQLIGRLDNDVTNLVFLLERGPDLKSQHDGYLPESEWPQNLPLRGSEARPDHSRQWLISGKVIDNGTKKPVARFRVTPGAMRGMWNSSSWDERNRAEGTNGSFLAFISKKYSQPVVKIEADGYLPQRFSLQPESRTNLNFELQKGTGPIGKVLLPDGSPAQEASVVLLCAGDQRVALNANGELKDWEHKESIVLTDTDGSFALRPDLDMVAVAAVAEEGFKISSVEALATDARVILEPWSKLKGVLYRESAPSTNEDVDLAFQNGPPLNLQLHTMTDVQGRFEFARVPPGGLQLNGRNMINTHSWSWDPLQPVTLKPGETLEIEVRAGARPPAAKTLAAGPHPGQPTLTRKAGPGPQGVVLLPNGKPATDAEVALLVPTKYVAVGKGTFQAYEARQEGLVVRAGSDGHFSLPLEEGAFGIVAVHDQGFAYIPSEELRSSPQIQLQPWGRIEGTLHIGSRLGTNELVILESGNPLFGEAQINFDQEAFQARTDSSGRFVLTFVPPGERRIARIIPQGDRSWVHSAATLVMVKPGEVTHLNMGGSGRTVIGKLHLTGREPDWQHVHVSLHNAMPNALNNARTPAELKALASSTEAKLAIKNYRAYPVLVSNDGSFRAEEVLPGKYDFDLTTWGTARQAMSPPEMSGQCHREVVVPEGEAKDTPADLGTLEITLEPPKQTTASSQSN